VTLKWDASPAADLDHYSVYFGTASDFACDNASVIRSVRKTSVTDAGMPAGQPLFYKVVAYDSRMNASEPAVVEVAPLEAPGR
jgi:fibronectin type 3 domain-containing protein